MAHGTACEPGRSLSEKGPGYCESVGLDPQDSVGLEGKGRNAIPKVCKRGWSRRGAGPVATGLKAVVGSGFQFVASQNLKKSFFFLNFVFGLTYFFFPKKYGLWTNFFFPKKNFYFLRFAGTNSAVSVSAEVQRSAA